jgi:hypothetical protein
MKREQLLKYRDFLTKKLNAVNVLLEADEPDDAEEPQDRGLQRTLFTPITRTPPKKPLIDAVAEATQKVIGEFTSKEVLTYLHQTYPHLNTVTSKDVSGPLAKLAARGKIVLKEKGFGSRPHLYYTPYAAPTST